MKSSLTFATQATLSLFYCHARRGLRDEKASNDIRRSRRTRKQPFPSGGRSALAKSCLFKTATLSRPLLRTILARTTWTIINKGKPDLVEDQDQQYKITLDIEGKADRTAKGYKFICPIFRLNKASLYQGLEKLSENRKNGYSI